MADHYIAVNRGIEGFRQADFITSTASTAGTNQIELRLADGASLTKKDAVLALKAFERFLENAPWCAAAGVDLKL